MNDAKKLGVETCISGLKNAILDFLEETGQERERLGPKEIRDKSGIGDQFQLLDLKDKTWSTNFTNILLLEMQEEKLVKNHGPKGKPAWKITAKGLEKLQETS